jgi:hypothetical protein
MEIQKSNSLKEALKFVDELLQLSLSEKIREEVKKSESYSLKNFMKKLQ